MSASNKLIQAAAGVGGGEPDADFANTVLLLNADDASDGGQNNTFLDSSSNAHTITRNGNVTQGSFSPFSVDDGKWGNYFDGSSDYLTLASDTSLSFGTGDYTVEAWVYALNSSGANKTIWTTNWGANGSLLFTYDHPSVGAKKFGLFDHTFNAGSPILTSSSTFEPNEWHHVALVRSGTTAKIYVNGTEEASATQSTNLTRDVFGVGSVYTASATQTWAGYISNIRAVKGTAVYTSAFTPSTTPLTDVSGTSLLTCQSNRFVDNSSNAHSITVNGDTKVVPFSPFPQTTAYDASTNGGSGYFDGTGNSLVVASDASLAVGSGAFTIETWIYSPSGSDFFNTYKALYSTGSSSTSGTMDVRLNSSKNIAVFYGTSGSFTSTNAVSDNEWTHFALVREGTGTNQTKIYLNGVLDSSHTVSENFTDTNFRIGVNRASNTRLNDYLTDLRVVKGTAVYTSAFTPPTAPLTDITNTSLLTNFTNASVFDATGKNVLETVGNAQVDTTTFKYGTGAMEFDGNGDYLQSNSNIEQYQFGTGDFTIECWVNKSGQGTNNYDGVAKLGTASAASDGWYLEVSTTRGIFFTIAGGQVIYGTWTNDSAWHHVAVTRESGTVRIFLDGSIVQTGTLATSVPTNGTAFFVGNNFTGTNYFFNGYIDDLRITKGIARYTTTFTPPEKALPVIGEE